MILELQVQYHNKTHPYFVLFNLMGFFKIHLKYSQLYKYYNLIKEEFNSIVIQKAQLLKVLLFKFTKFLEQQLKLFIFMQLSMIKEFKQQIALI
ncbi:unnamed protein product [Paramecium primaurelia]|uniref:Uncharacterized protein n=1 Tax=Paramecium primaurelia TaxID=5886 RepID=A0A8S1QGJ6_PARPR|nr:unnamed protein product [Paramecium primaurelia]